jgi:hypothetical protein
MSGSEVKIKDLPAALLADLSVDDFLYLVQGGTNIDNKLTLEVLYSYLLNKINTDSFNPLIDNRLATVFSPNKTLNKNLLINGDFRIWQRNSTFSLTTNSTTYTADRWSFKNTTPQGNFTIARTVGLNASTVSGRAVRITSNTISAPGNLEFRQIIEGFNCSHLQWGTPNAKPITVQFKVYASQAGNYALHIQNSFVGGAGDRSYVTTFTVNIANTYETKTITIPGCTDGTWASDHTFGILIGFDLGSASNATSSLNSWLNGQFYGTSNVISIGATVGSYLELADIQVEMGSSATTYEYLPYDLSLNRCQRYYEKTFSIDTPATQNNGETSIGAVSYATGGRAVVTWNYKVTKRVNPTVTTFCPNAASANFSANPSTPVVEAYQGGVGSVLIYSTSANTTINNIYYINAVANAEL